MDLSAPHARALLDWWTDAGVAWEAPPTPPSGATATVASPRVPARPSTVSGETPAAAARALAARCQTLAELREAVASFEGCALKKTARSTVFSDGPESADLMLIGEAPGKDEDQEGKPFVGRSGQLLDRMLEAVGVSRRSNLFISNMIYWRPPGNRPPTQGEIAACMPFVERAIQLKQPRLLLLAGGFAAQTLLRRNEGVTKLRGKRLRLENEAFTMPVNAMVMLHPAYLLRQPQQKRLAWTDLLTLESWLNELGVAHGPGL